ncbi:MAG TPA: hypothetical protein VH833_07935 [Gemmatimonadales bacterium]|jgi:hypothetical protein
MRVVSLLPAATEIVAALGGAIGAPGGAHAASGPTLVGISHECNFPPEVGVLRRVTRTTLDSTLSSREIDRSLAAARSSGTSPITIDIAALAPECVIVALCGFGLARARQEVAGLRDAEAVRLRSRGVEFLDGNAYTSRPGPRLVDAAERLAALIPG